MRKSQEWSTARVTITISGQPAASVPLQATLEDKPQLSDAYEVSFSQYIQDSLSPSTPQVCHTLDTLRGWGWSFCYQVPSELRVIFNGRIGQRETNKETGLTYTGLNVAPASHPPAANFRFNFHWTRLVDSILCDIEKRRPGRSRGPIIPSNPLLTKQMVNIFFFFHPFLGYYLIGCSACCCFPMIPEVAQTSGGGVRTSPSDLHGMNSFIFFYLGKINKKSTRITDFKTDLPKASDLCSPRRAISP